MLKCFNFDVQIVLVINKTKKNWSKLNPRELVFITGVVMGMFQKLLTCTSGLNTRENDTLMGM